MDEYVIRRLVDDGQFEVALACLDEAAISKTRRLRLGEEIRKARAAAGSHTAASAHH